MKALLTALLDFVLYSNLWIAVGATAMAAQTQYLLWGQAEPTPLLGFVFFATLFLYALHRIFGLRRAGPFLATDRYAFIARFQGYWQFYTLALGLCAGLFFLQLPFPLMGAVLLPCLLALAYVLPVWKGRRLRDWPYVKIFLLALAWSWITVFLPALELGLSFSIPMYAILMERALFVFALALPFDIRDLDIDAHQQVKTLPAVLGLPAAQRLSAACLLGMSLLAALNHYWDVYTLGQLSALVASAALAALLALLATPARSDYYFAGLVDGMLILQCLLVVAF